MIYLVSKSRNENHITFSLVVLLLVIIAGGIYFSLPLIKNTEVYKNYESNREVTFTSKRADFSFKHPNWWPVSVVDFEAKNGMYKYLSEDGIVEYVDFEEEFSSQAGGPSLGFITVGKSKYDNLNDYVASINKDETVDMYGKGRTQKVFFPAPKITYLKIGGVDAISVTEANILASFSNNIADYRLIKNGLFYRFATVDSSRFLENKERNSETFQTIISSVQFSK